MISEALQQITTKTGNMEKTNQERESITIRITGREIQQRLSNLEASVRMLKYAAAIELPILIVILSTLLIY